MNGKVVNSLLAIALTITFIGFVGFASAQDKPADNMEIVKEKIRTDKKLLIAKNMQLTESEANAFWPVYEAYQAELGKLRDREVKLIEEFAANYETMSDDVAKNLLDDSLSIDSGHQKLRQSYLSKFRGRDTISSKAKSMLSWNTRWQEEYRLFGNVSGRPKFGRSHNLAPRANGSTYRQRTQPALKTWFHYFRLYLPKKVILDRSWVLPDIDKVK